MMKRLKIALPGLPPSTNKLYENFRGGRRLSTEGKRYKHKIATYIAQEFPVLAPFKNSDAFSLKIRLEFDIFVRTKGAKSCYKRFDVSNRIKVLEDAICESFGIDDCQVLTLEIKKCPTKGPERTVVMLRKLPPVTRPPS
jgi:Holliday junction resolvase RusA-like endonuclease